MWSPFFTSQACAFMTILFWSSAFVFTVPALEAFSVGALAFLRCATASLCLGCILAAQRTPFPGIAAMPQFFISGAAGFALYILAFNSGSSHLNPTTSCIIVSTAPIITSMLAMFFFKERLSLAGWASVFFAFCGVCIMTLWDGVFSASQGVFWMSASALLISVYNVLQRGLTRKYRALQVTAYSFFTGALMLTPFLPQAVVQLQNASMAQIALVCFLGVCPSAAAYLLWTKALSIAPQTSGVANYMFLTPFAALLLEYAVTKDLPGLGTFFGGGVILAGLLLFAATAKKRA